MTNIAPGVIMAETRMPDFADAPALVADSQVLQAAAQPAQEEALPQAEPAQVYSYRHASGEVVSGTIEEARKVCPALGRLSVESAERLAQLRELAQKKMAERHEAATKEADQERKPPIVKLQKTEPAKAKEKSVAEARREVIPVAQLAEPELALQPQQASPLLEAAPKKVAVTGTDTAPHVPNHLPKVVRTEVLDPKPSPLVFAPVPELQLLKPLELRPFETIFPAEAAMLLDAPQNGPEKTVDLLVETTAEVLPEAATIYVDAEQTQLWEEADLSAEVDQLLVELGMVPRLYDAEVVGKPESFSTALNAEQTEPAEDTIRSFTEALLKAPPADEDHIEPAYGAVPIIQGVHSHAEDRPVEPLAAVIAEKLSQIEPDFRQEAAGIMRSIVEAVQKIAGLPLVAPPEGLQKVEQELEELCVQLMKLIGLPANEQSVKCLVRIVRQISLTESGSQQSPAFIDYMHERKPGTMDLQATNPFAQAWSLLRIQSAAFGYLAIGSAARK